MHRISRRTIICMLVIAGLAIISNLLGRQQCPHAAGANDSESMILF
jgi:hypothetical protein